MRIAHSKCTGCLACVDVCPLKCITVTNDEEGFVHPKVDSEKCQNCGLCDRVCPVQHKRESRMGRTSFYAAKSKNKEVQMYSASGGLFSVISTDILKHGGYVIGGGWSNLEVIPMCIGSTDELGKLQRSKYVQSNCKGIYNVIKRKLQKGDTILFSGTPCQINALSSYLRDKLKDKLYLVEVVCHGVPSPKVWEEFVKTVSKKYKKSAEEIKSIEFKYKDGKDFFWNHPGFCIEWTDGTKMLEYSNCTWYENGFLGNLYVRPSCHICNFKNLETDADLTIGDFWGCENLYGDFFDTNGVSVVSVNTQKGKELFERIRPDLDCIEISKEDAVKYNPRFISPTKPSKKRKLFWRRFAKFNTDDSCAYDNLEKLVDKCIQSTWLEKISLNARIKFGKFKRLFL